MYPSNAVQEDTSIPMQMYTVDPLHLTDEGAESAIDSAEDEIGLVEDEELPVIPYSDTPETELGLAYVEYSDRGPRDVVVSGPITGGSGPGRWHKNRRVAYWRMVSTYGADRVKQLRQSQGRWSFLIKNLRAE